jgi:hypothetical protein
MQTIILLFFLTCRSNSYYLAMLNIFDLLTLLKPRKHTYFGDKTTNNVRQIPEIHDIQKHDVSICHEIPYPRS